MPLAERFIIIISLQNYITEQSLSITQNGENKSAIFFAHVGWFIRIRS